MIKLEAQKEDFIKPSTLQDPQRNHQ